MPPVARKVPRLVDLYLDGIQYWSDIDVARAEVELRPQKRWVFSFAEPLKCEPCGGSGYVIVLRRRKPGPRSRADRMAPAPTLRCGRCNGVGWIQRSRMKQVKVYEFDRRHHEPLIHISGHAVPEYQRRWLPGIGSGMVNCCCPRCAFHAARVTADRVARARRLATKAAVERARAKALPPGAKACPRCGCTPGRPCAMDLGGGGTGTCMSAGVHDMPTCTACAVSKPTRSKAKAALA